MAGAVTGTAPAGQTAHGGTDGRRNRRPNIVLIVADDMGYGDCSCFGSEQLHTPHIDSIARRGVRFTDFHSNGAVCSPTRAALLTGRYPQRSGIEGVITAARHRHVGLPLTERTFADLLRAAGYRTALFGKWHLGYEERFNPSRRGFDEFVGFVSGNIDYRSHIDQVGMEDWWKQDALTPEDGYTTDLVTEHGARFIRQNRDGPFCLYLAHECPHYPYQGPGDEAYRTPGHPEPVSGPREDKPQAYKEMMEAMDAGIGKILETVHSCGLEEDTLVFFFSDNGPSGPGSSGGLRGGKGTLWEGGHRVPAAASWKGRLPEGVETAAPCMSMDLLPTMLALAEAQAPSGLVLDGVDILPVMSGSVSGLERNLFWRQKAQRAIRRGKWKLVLDGAGGAPRELFDLERDRPESRNVITEHPALARELEAEIVAWESDIATTERLT